MSSRFRRLGTAAAFAARSPKEAYRALYERATAPIAKNAEADRFARAMQLLMGLDVGLTFERDGVTWTVPPGEDGIAEELFDLGAYFGDTLDAVMRFVTERRSEHEWVIDVGANIGSTTVPLAAAGYHVLAIEPVPACLRFLKANVESNELNDRVRILEGAIARGNEVLIATSTSLGNCEVIPDESSAPMFTARYGRGETIRAAAFDLESAAASEGIAHESVALVWSDIQGSDTAVIETGAGLWAAGVPLFVELWLDGLAAKGGVDRFIEAANEHFSTFVDGANGGRDIVLMLDQVGQADGTRPRPVSDLGAFAEDVGYYPAAFTDVLLLP